MKLQDFLAGVLVLVLLITLGCTTASEPESQSAKATAAIRFIHTLPGPALQLVFEGEPLTDLPWDEETFRTSWAHAYV